MSVLVEAALLDVVDRLLVLRFGLLVELLFQGQLVPVVEVRAFGLEVVDFVDLLWCRWNLRLLCC